MKKIKIFLLTLVATFSLSGCIYDEDIPQSDETMTIMFRTAAIREASTRAIGVNSQNAVRDLYMVAYDASSKKFLYYKKAKSIVDSNADGSVKYAKFDYKETEQNDNLALRFYANVDDLTNIASLLGSLEAGGSELDGEDAVLEFNLSSAWNANSDSDYTPIPMWGGLVGTNGKRSDAGITLIEGNNDVNGITVNLMRALARVNVVVNGQDGYDGVKVSSVKVVNAYNDGYVTPDLDKMADDNTYKVKLPSVAGFAPMTEPLVYDFSPAEIACNNTIFLPEAPKEDQTFLIVALTDGADTKYIKLAFLNTDFKNVDILRSYNYTFHIFTSPDSGLMGYATETEALANEPYNVKVDLDIVNDVYHNVMLTDDTTVLYIYDDEVRIPLSGGTFQFMVYTNYAEGWTISNYLALAEIAPDLKFYKKNDESTSYLDGFRGEGYLNYYCTIELGPSSVNREIEMRMDAGTIYKNIHVCQMDDE